MIGVPDPCSRRQQDGEDPCVAARPSAGPPRITRWVAIQDRGSPRGMLEGADDLEVLVDEDVVRPVDADVVNLVLAVAQLNNTVDDAPRVGG
jgi:hypothetical protein